MEAKHLNLTLLREKWAVGGVERDEPVPLRIQLKHHGGGAEDPMGVPMASPQTTSTFPKAHTARAASAMAAASMARWWRGQAYVEVGVVMGHGPNGLFTAQ